MRLLLNKALEKKDIKVRLQEGNVLEIEWPRALESVDIPID